MKPELNKSEVKRMKQEALRTRRVWEVLDLIVAEFQSDPMSVQCFDLRIVEEARKLVADQKRDARFFDPLFEKPAAERSGGKDA